MSHSFASLIGALVATGLLAWSGTASAEMVSTGGIAALGGGYSSSDAPLGASTELRIDLRGRVASRCELLTPPTATGALRLDREGESQSAFAIDCNAPFIMRVRSGQGGFASIDPTPGIATLVPYQMAVAVGTDAGRQDLGWCDAAALGEAPAGICAYGASNPQGGWSSGDATAINQKGSLRLRWRQQNKSDAPLLGVYRDTIVIQLEVRS